MPYLLFIDDNFHYMDESERLGPRVFETEQAVFDAARAIVDDDLKSAYKTGMSYDELLTSYLMFGADPFIVCKDVPKISFSARDYAREKCALLCPRPFTSGRQ